MAVVPLEAPPEGGPPSSPPPERRRAGKVALALAVILTLVANAGALVLLDDADEESVLAQRPSERGGESPPPPPAAPEPTATSAPSSTRATSTTVPDTPLAREVAALSRFVEDQRELEFLRPVEVQVLTDEPFLALLFADAEENREETDQSEKVLRALGLIEPGVDLFEAFTSFYGDAVLGFYDAETDQLVIRGSELSAYTRTTLVHELAHALDDQHFELYRPEVYDADDESSLAFSSLIEGVSLAVEFAYRQTLSAAEQEESARLAAEFAGRAGASPIPSIVSSLVQFPYLAGPSFVGALVEEGREPRIDQAYRHPPTTSEEILDPSVYLRGEQPVTVAVPAAGGPVVDEGTYGEWALSLTLAELIGSQAGTRAADGWGGDSYVAWDEAGRTCVRMAYAMDSPGDLVELERAWRQWAEVHGDATVEAGSALVTVTACG